MIKKYYAMYLALVKQDLQKMRLTREKEKNNIPEKLKNVFIALYNNIKETKII